MSSKIIVIVGLPGSGKTYLGKKLTEDTGFEFLDDVTKTQMGRLKALLDEGKSCIVSDPNLVIEPIRKSAAEYLAKFPNLEIEWIFFENNPKQCMNNVTRRNDGRKVFGFIEAFSKKYVVPDGAKVVKVYSNAKSRTGIPETIQQRTPQVDIDPRQNNPKGC